MCTLCVTVIHKVDKNKKIFCYPAWVTTYAVVEMDQTKGIKAGPNFEKNADCQLINIMSNRMPS